MHEYAEHDIKAFVKRIREIKKNDLRAILPISVTDAELDLELDKRLKITCVAHSLGGMALLLYLIHSKRTPAFPHHISHAILLSPAGFQQDTTPVIKIIAWIFSNIVAKFVDHIACPDEIINLVQKLHRDLSRFPASRLLISKIAEFLLGGKSPVSDISYSHPIWKSAFII